MKEKNNKDVIEEKENNIIKGNVSKGVYKGEQFEIYIGKTPADTKVIIGDSILNIVKRIDLTIDCESAVNEIKVTSWALPKVE